MPVDDAISDISGALGGGKPSPAPSPAMSYSMAPTQPQPSPQAQPSAPQQTSGVDAALDDLSKSPEQIKAALTPPAPAKEGGLMRNVAAGANEVVAGMMGAPVDTAAWLVNKVTSPFTGANDSFGPATKLSVPPSMANVPQPAPAQPLIQNPVGGSESIKSAMGLIGADPRNVGTNDWQEGVARNLGGDVAGMVAPYYGARGLIARGVGALDASGAPQSLGGAAVRMVGGPAPPDAGILRTGLGAAGNAAIGAGGSLAGQGAQALLPDNSPYRGVANMTGQLLGGGLMAGGMGLAKLGLNTGVNQARDVIAPMSQAGREGIVGRKLVDNASDPIALSNALEKPNPELVPGSQPTTYQLSGDQGIGQLERAQRTVNPAPFLDRVADQNAARVGQIQNLAPENANAGAVRNLMMQRLAGLDQEGDANIAQAQQNAQQRFAQLGGQGSPEDYGGLIRDQMEAAKSATKQSESTLWQAIDPEGTLKINGKPVAQAANQILGEIPATAKPQDGEEKAVFGFARMLGSAAPFSDFSALRGRLLQAIRDERINGQTPALRRMQQLRSAMDGTISNAAENAAQQEAPAVAAGSMAPEQTMLGRLLGQAQAHYDDRNVSAPAAFRQLAGGGVVGEGGGNTAPLPGANGGIRAGNGGQGPAGGGLGGSQGNQGVQGPAPVANFDAEAAARYRAAADATRARAATFNNPQVGPILQERGTDYRLANSQVPNRVLASPEGIQGALNAGVRPETLQDALVADLRRSAAGPDGSLNTTRYASWVLRRADALRMFPQLAQHLQSASAAQSAVDQVAGTARQNTLKFQRGAARHFLNAEPTQAVQSALASKNPVADFGQLAATVASDPDAKAGLQRAVADYISRNYVGNTEAGTSGVGALKSDAFQTFLNRNGMALGQVFTPDQMKGMQAIAADLQRSNRSIVGSKIPGSPGTAQDLNAVDKLGMFRRHVGQSVLGAIGGLGGYLIGGLHGAIEGAGGMAMAKGALDKLRAAGLERTDQLMTEALLNPQLANTLLMKASGPNRPFIAHRLMSQLGTLLAVSGAQEGARQ